MIIVIASAWAAGGRPQGVAVDGAGDGQQGGCARMTHPACAAQAQDSLLAPRADSAAGVLGRAQWRLSAILTIGLRVNTAKTASVYDLEKGCAGLAAAKHSCALAQLSQGAAVFYVPRARAPVSVLHLRGGRKIRMTRVYKKFVGNLLDPVPVPME